MLCFTFFTRLYTKYTSVLFHTSTRSDTHFAGQYTNFGTYTYLSLILTDYNFLILQAIKSIVFFLYFNIIISGYTGPVWANFVMCYKCASKKCHENMSARLCKFKWKNEATLMRKTTAKQVFGDLEFTPKDKALTEKQTVWCFSFGRAENDEAIRPHWNMGWQFTPKPCRTEMPAICKFLHGTQKASKSILKILFKKAFLDIEHQSNKLQKF